MIYQESHFNPRAQSHTGVRGIMQVTRETARQMGVNNRLDPHQSIMAGVRYLKKLHGHFQDTLEPDRTKLTLAAYNVGYGHVLDAQVIAMQHGLPPEKWSSVSQALPLLRQRKYYKGSIYGYCRGTEPVLYVNKVLAYYDILRARDATGNGRKRYNT